MARRPAILCSSVLLGLLGGCKRDQPATPAANAARVAVGKQAIGALKKNLVGALTEAMKAGAPAAITACNTQAPAITQALGVDGVTVGRATRKPRNPANAATGWQLDALASFEAMVGHGEKLEGASFSRELPDGTTAYAEPLLIQPLCLTCHGAELAPDVSAALAAAYPADQATGYALADLRGVAWAEIAAPRK